MTRSVNSKTKKTAPNASIILTAIDERLWALESEVKELEEAAAADRTKDEDKQKLAEILRREEYQRPEQKEESLFQKWTREFMEWLAKMFPRVKMPESTGGGFSGFHSSCRYLLYALVIGAIGFIVYKFAPFLFGRYGARVKKEKKDRVILGELYRQMNRPTACSARPSAWPGKATCAALSAKGISPFCAS